MIASCLQISFSEAITLALSSVIVFKYSRSRLFNVSNKSHDSLNFLLKKQHKKKLQNKLF